MACHRVALIDATELDYKGAKPLHAGAQTF